MVKTINVERMLLMESWPYLSGMTFFKLVNTDTLYDMPQEYSEYGLEFFFILNFWLLGPGKMQLRGIR